MNDMRVKIPQYVADLSGQTTIWPTWLRLTTRRGYTLWGGNFDDGSDRFLAVEGKIPLYSTLDSLWDALPGLDPGPFDNEEFDALRHGIGASLNAPADNCYQVEGFDFAGTLDAIRERMVQSEPISSTVLDCLNAIRDIATQFPHVEELMLLSKSEPLDTLYKVLWGNAESEALDYQACEAALGRCNETILKLSYMAA